MMTDSFKKDLYYILSVFFIVILGTYVRFKGYSANPSFYFDESALVANIKARNYIDLFASLDYCQVCPPFFLVISKFLTGISGFLELNFRLVPFLFGCFSIVAFFFLADSILQNKVSVLVSLVLFAINDPLIVYSYTFKPYTLELFFTILLLLFFVKLNLEKISLTKCFFIGTIISFIPWIAFSPVFIVGGGFLNMFFKEAKSNILKKLCMFLPVLINGLFFLTFLVVKYCKSNKDIFAVWGDFFKGFIKLDSSLFFLVRDNIQWIFGVKQSFIIFLVLMFIGVYLFYKSKSEFLKISVISFILLFILSCLHLYPFYQRFILFLLPSFIILMVKPLDLVFLKKNAVSIITIFVFLFILATQIIKLRDFLTRYYFENALHSYSRQMFTFMKEHMSKEDKIIVNAESFPDFSYYCSDYYNNITTELSWNREETKQLLRDLLPGNYWLCMPDNFGTVPISMLQSISKKLHIIKTYKSNKSYLLYVKVD